MKLWKFHQEYGRMGSLSSMFFATDMQIETLKQHSIYLDDVLGKHSEVEVYFNDKNLVELKLSQSTINELQTVVGDFISGDFYPFDYMDQWDEE